MAQLKTTVSNGSVFCKRTNQLRTAPNNGVDGDCLRHPSRKKAK